METQRTPVEVFYSSSDSPMDAPLLAQLDRHLSTLQREGWISTWHRRQVAAGSVTQEELDRHLRTASLILLLISSDFLASDYCYGAEMQYALQRHQTGEAQVLPILLRPCDWQSAPFAALQMLPVGARPVTLWRNRDAAWTTIATSIRQVLNGQSLSDVAQEPLSQEIVWNIPYRRNPYFTGRDELLSRLAQQLAPQEREQGMRKAALTQPQAIQGLGGIGKTQVAVEYAYRARERGQYTYILWLNASSEEMLLGSFVELAALLPTFSAQKLKEQSKLVEAVKRWLEHCQERWLLIFDNADDIALVRNYLPASGNGSILLTTRAHAVGALAVPMEVEMMGFTEGTSLLLRRSQRFEQISDEAFNQAGNIVVALDHFPLALDQAGAYIEETQCSFSEYLELYQTNRQVLLAQRGLSATDYPDSVATTWLLSFQKVQQANPAAAELLELCSFLAPDHIPEELLRENADYWPPALHQAVADLRLFQQLIAELLKFSLVHRLVEERALSIHRLVQAVQRDRITSEAQHGWAERAVQAVNALFPESPEEPDTWPVCLRYLDQAQACYTLIEQFELASFEAASILNRTGLYLSEHGLYALAEPLYKRFLKIVEQQVGAEHPAMATGLNNLAEIYDEQGRYAEAEPLLQQALAIYEQEAGATHLNTAMALNNLAGLYREQGRYEEAEPLSQRALAIYEQEAGEIHPNTATSLNNLAELYKEQGRYEEAEPLLQRALAIYEQMLGETHPSIAMNLNNLATLFYMQARYDDAERLMLRALAIVEQQMGAEHPRTASGLNNLAQLYSRQGKYEEAEPLLWRALAIREQHLGPTHPDTASTLSNLASLYKAQGRYAEAESLLQRTLAIDEQELGTTHPDTARACNNLANFYTQQKRYTEAEPLIKRAIAIREQHLGATHPDTATSLNNLAMLYFEQEKYDEAKPLMHRALAIMVQQLGAAHPQTQQTKQNYSLILLGIQVKDDPEVRAQLLAHGKPDDERDEEK